MTIAVAATGLAFFVAAALYHLIQYFRKTKHPLPLEKDWKCDSNDSHRYHATQRFYQWLSAGMSIVLSLFYTTLLLDLTIYTRAADARQVNPWRWLVFYSLLAPMFSTLVATRVGVHFMAKISLCITAIAASVIMGLAIFYTSTVLYVGYAIAIAFVVASCATLYIRRAWPKAASSWRAAFYFTVGYLLLVLSASLGQELFAVVDLSIGNLIYLIIDLIIFFAVPIYTSTRKFHTAADTSDSRKHGNNAIDLPYIVCASYGHVDWWWPNWHRTHPEGSKRRKRRQNHHRHRHTSSNAHLPGTSIPD